MRHIQQAHIVELLVARPLTALGALSPPNVVLRQEREEVDLVPILARGTICPLKVQKQRRDELLI